MFAAINLLQGGYFISRADLIGFTDEEIEHVNQNRAAPERVGEVNGRLQIALNSLFQRKVEGRPC